MTHNQQLRIALLMAGTLTYGGAAVAHHSYAATYFLDKTVDIQGEIATFMYRNPHSILQVLAPGADGKTYRWACEWAGTLSLDHSGVNRLTPRPGDKVIITGVPGRNLEDHRLLVKTIQRPADGWKWAGDSRS
jgi:hypothetical protein